MNQLDLIRKFQTKLPAVCEWINNLLERHKDQAVPVITLGFAKLQKLFPADLLGKSKVVVVTTKLPVPPLSRMGLPEFVEMENMSMDGITYKNTFFINHLHQPVSLYFHELVHVIQWGRLGVDNFLLAYAAGLMQFDHFDYRNSPSERMAFSLQTGFDSGCLPTTDIVGLVQRRTDAIWNGLASLFVKA